MIVFFWNLCWKLTFIISLTTQKIIFDYFVVEVSNVTGNTNSLIACATKCNFLSDCCGLTVESLALNCVLFYYSTSNKCLITTNTSEPIQLVKQLRDCSELPPNKPNGVYSIYPSRHTAVLVYCEMTDAGGGWTVLQRRLDGSENFYRYWADYKNGFGDLEIEFWLGNDIIHDITSQKRHKVRFDFEDYDNQTVYAEYEYFYVDDESLAYAMNISGYSGTAGSPYGLDYAKNGIVPFSTRDVDNDQATYSCGNGKRSGWWHIRCTGGNINGLYEPGVSHSSTMYWYSWRAFQGLNKTRMMIKPIL